MKRQNCKFLPEKKNFMTFFYGLDLTASRLEPLQGGSLLFTTKIVIHVYPIM